MATTPKAKSTVVRVPGPAYAALQRLAADDGTTIAEALAKAVEAFETQRFWEGVAADYAALKADPEAWADYQREFAEMEQATIADGLADWPWYEGDEPPTVSRAAAPDLSEGHE